MATEKPNQNENPNPNQNKNPVQSDNLAQNFLYLQPSENLVTPLVSHLLDSTNYHSWSHLVIIVLSAKNKLEFIKGLIPQPSELDPTFASWIRCNNMVASWLVHSIFVPIRKSIIWMEKALDVWSDLKAHFSQGDLSRIFDLQMEASF